MDYCHPCRRHLNGALACPGCGAPVEELRAYASEEASRAAEDTYEPEAEAEEESRPEAGAGTSRRDRKAAAHRRRRRRTLLIAAGFLLAAGGLSLAELGMDAPGSSPAPAAAGDTSVDGGAKEEATDPAEPISNSEDEVWGSASPSTSASPSPSKSGKESEKPEDKPTKEPQSSTTEGGVQPGTTAAPEPTQADPTPTPTPDPTTQEPEPEPSETCTRFLWWCS